LYSLTAYIEAHIQKVSNFFIKKMVSSGTTQNRFVG
jgi:hypothetical protein